LDYRDAWNNGAFLEPLFFGVDEKNKCKGATANDDPVVEFGTYCYFPNKLSHNKVPFSHWECPTGIKAQTLLGWYVPLGDYCQAVCTDGQRVDTLMDRLYCRRPVNAKWWDTAEFWSMMSNSASYFKTYHWLSKISWGFDGSPNGVYYTHNEKYRVASLYQASKFYQAKFDLVGKCHVIKETECAPILDTDYGDNQGFMTCTNGNQPDSICSKTCNAGFGNLYDYGETKADAKVVCRCKDKCEWSGPLADCSPKTCAFPKFTNPKGQQPTNCYLKGEKLDFDDYFPDGFPVGTICKNECDQGYGLSHGDGHSQTECTCGDFGYGEGNWCQFNQMKVAYCVPAVCSASLADVRSWLHKGTKFGGFITDEQSANGFDYGDEYQETTPSVDHFTSFNCPPDAIWSNTGDPKLDGKVKSGATCTLGCDDGFYVHRASPELTCSPGPHNPWGIHYHWDQHWKMLGSPPQYYDDYGYWGADYTGGKCGHPGWPCDVTPICAPEGHVWHSNYWY
jgi:hypothetical protein